MCFIHLPCMLVPRMEVDGGGLPQSPPVWLDRVLSSCWGWGGAENSVLMVPCYGAQQSCVNSFGFTDYC